MKYLILLMSLNLANASDCETNTKALIKAYGLQEQQLTKVEAENDRLNLKMKAWYTKRPVMLFVIAFMIGGVFHHVVVERNI